MGRSGAWPVPRAEADGGGEEDWAMVRAEKVTPGEFEDRAQASRNAKLFGPGPWVVVEP